METLWRDEQVSWAARRKAAACAGPPCASDTPDASREAQVTESLLSPCAVLRRSCGSGSGSLISGGRNIWLAYVHGWFLKERIISNLRRLFLLKTSGRQRKLWLIASSSFDIWNYEESMCRNTANIAFFKTLYFLHWGWQNCVFTLWQK